MKYVYEIARTATQLFFELIVFSMGLEDEVTQECLDFAQKVGISQATVHKIDQYTTENAGNKDFESLAEAWISLGFWDNEEI